MMIANISKPDVRWNIEKRILVKENVISPELCDELISFGNDSVTKGINKYPGVFDISFHACLLPLEHDVHTVLQDTWKEVINHFKMDISFVEPYELKRYSENDFFGRHMDNYYSLDLDVDRKITMSVQLSDDTEYTGGDFQVLRSSNRLKKGSIIAFPSFFPHEVKKITSGSRWSLIGWAWGPYWK